MVVSMNSMLAPHFDWLRSQLRDWSGDGAAPEEGSDAYLLLEALIASDVTPFLPRFEQSGQRLAEHGGKLETRLQGLQGYADALGQALGDLLRDDPKHLAQAQNHLRAVLSQIMVALARGFQHVAERLAREEHERAYRGMSRLAAIQRVNAAANSSLDLDQTLQQIARAVAEEMRADLCSIFLYDETRRELILRATNGPRPQDGNQFSLRMGEGYSGWVADKGHPLIVADACADERFAYEASVYSPEYHGLLSLPIIFFTVEKLEGVMSVQTREPRAFTPEEVGFLEVVAGQLAMNIENGRLYEQTDEKLRRKVHELSTLHRVSTIIASTLDLEEVLQTIAMQAVHLSGAERSAIFELDEQTQEMRLLANYGLETPALGRTTIKVGQCCAGRAVQNGEPLTSIGCMHTDTGCFLRTAPELLPDIQSVLCVPLKGRGRVRGVITVFSGQRYSLSYEQMQLVITFANEATIAIENARLYEETRRGLASKSLLLQEMHHRVKNNLQTVAGILSLQQRHTKSPAVAHLLAESVNRIQGIAATHDLLSREDVGMATVEEIARKIAGIVSANLAPPEFRLRLDVSADTIWVPSRQATILALVLNELVSNVFKHSFIGRGEGRILVNASHQDGLVTLSVADDGPGLPEDFDPQTSEGLGLSLVRTLVQADLRGTFTLHRGVLSPELLQLEAAAGEGKDEHSAEGDDQEQWTIAEVQFPSRAS
jgi:two-component sensor histidine kinase/putative methionine-R-sulfoxide reductase with GAF domain